MSIQAFHFPATIPEEPVLFARLFLLSSDFGQDSLKQICRQLGISPYINIELQVEKILYELDQNQAYQQAVFDGLILKKREWISFKRGAPRSLFTAANPVELLFDIGTQKWYGPIRSQFDPEATWYIRPQYFDHWSTSENDESTKFIVRWLCLIRVEEETVSLHWRGFTHTDEEQEIGSKSRVDYWNYIPAFFDEFEQQCGRKLLFPDVQNLVLKHLWDKYRYDKSNYRWADRRIRAEGDGVALSARAGSRRGIDIGGIRGLATSLRNSVHRELLKPELGGKGLPEPIDHFDEVVLKTLIQEFGPLSYEFALETVSEVKLYRTHAYFGAKRNSPSPDRFPHFRIFTSWNSDLNHLAFLTSELDEMSKK